MQRLRVTEGGKYTLWLNHNNRPSVVWVFDNTEMKYKGRIVDVETNKRSTADGKAKLKKGSVYILEG